MVRFLILLSLFWLELTAHFLLGQEPITALVPLQLVLDRPLSAAPHAIPFPDGHYSGTETALLLESEDRYRIIGYEDDLKKTIDETFKRPDTLADMQLRAAAYYEDAIHLFMRRKRRRGEKKTVRSVVHYRLDLTTSEGQLQQWSADNRELGEYVGAYSHAGQLIEVYLDRGQHRLLCLVSSSVGVRCDTVPFPASLPRYLVAQRKYFSTAWQQSLSLDLRNSACSIWPQGGQMYLRMDDAKGQLTHLLRYDAITGQWWYNPLRVPAQWADPANTVEVVSVLSGTQIVQAARKGRQLTLSCWDVVSGKLQRVWNSNDVASLSATFAQAGKQRNDAKIMPYKPIDWKPVVKKFDIASARLFLHVSRQPDQPLDVWVGVHHHQFYSNEKMWALMALPLSVAYIAVVASLARNNSSVTVAEPTSDIWIVLLDGAAVLGSFVFKGDPRSYLLHQTWDRERLQPVELSETRITPEQKARGLVQAIVDNDRYNPNWVHSLIFTVGGQHYLLTNRSNVEFVVYGLTE